MNKSKDTLSDTLTMYKTSNDLPLNERIEPIRINLRLPLDGSSMSCGFVNGVDQVEALRGRLDF